MEMVILLWEWYKTFVGVVTLVFTIFVPLSLVFFRIQRLFTTGKCPGCGGYKFGEMIGGPPKCIKCGWQQENSPWSGVHPNFQKHGYYTVPWPEEKPESKKP